MVESVVVYLCMCVGMSVLMNTNLFAGCFEIGCWPSWGLLSARLKSLFSLAMHSRFLLNNDP